jgi:hypothetical protein
VVREAVRISEPRYAIKNLEVFYLDAARSGEVKTAGESIIIYERFRRTGTVELLEQIEAYDKFDCQSLRLCRDWLLTLRPANLPWPSESAPEKADPVREQSRIEAEQRTDAHIKALTDGCPPDERPWRELLAYLLEFHRREIGAEARFFKVMKTLSCANRANDLGSPIGDACLPSFVAPRLAAFRSAASRNPRVSRHLRRFVLDCPHD